MTERDFIDVDAYLEGKTAAWTFVRRLRKAGLSIGTAIAFTALMPAAAQTGDLSSLERLSQGIAKSNPNESAVLEQLLKRVAKSLITIQDGGGQDKLVRSLTRLSLNVANNNEGNANLAFNGEARNIPVNVFGRLNLVDPAPDIAAAAGPNRPEQNLALNLGGTVGEVPVNLAGFVNVNVNGQPGPRGVNLNVAGNLGQIPIQVNVNTPR
jgi:hypothetical protein